MKKIREFAHEQGFEVQAAVSDFSRCYADKENTVIVNYNGDLFKCTARDFMREKREGVITSEGELIWNTKYSERMAIKYGNDTCKQCLIYPLCHAGCSQVKMESASLGCLRGYTEAQKEQVIRTRIDWLIENQK